MPAFARALIRSSHPEPVLGVTAGMTALAAAAGRGLPGTLAVAAAVLAGQLSIGWSNDYLDRHRDARLGRADKPVARGAVPAAAVAAAAVTALALCVPLSLLSGWRAALAHLAAIGAGWVYNAGLKGSAWSFAAFVPGFGLLPAFVTLGLPGHPWPAWWALAAGALLGVGAHFANVLPDLPGDLATGVYGLPQRLSARFGGPGPVRLVAAFLLAATALVLAAGPGRLDAVAVAGVAATAAILGAGLAARVQLARAAMMYTVIGVALLDVTLLIARGRQIH